MSFKEYFKESLRKSFTKIDTKWAITFVISVILFVLYVFIAAPMVKGSTGIKRMALVTWFTSNMLLVMVSEYKMFEPYLKKVEDQSYSQRMKTLKRTAFGSLVGVFSVFTVIIYENNPTQIEERALASIFLMFSGLSLYSLICILYLYLQNVAEKRYPIK